ncbi:PspA/IM30 family protein [Hahella ganghwensis]|uniref:PspA/IM30 family protein n=1 Tax=Hahella ganghwensis TaxID=286420 RepID=UPI00036D12AB|nr:PspA/IM30 family protein [Hahella ganghwensis]
MSFKKLWTALKGGVNEAAEAAADTQAIRILDQEIREAKNELQKCDQQLTTIMGKRKLAEKKVTSLQSDIEQYTSHALKAHEQGNMELAEKAAERVEELENTMVTEQEMLNGFLKSEKVLKADIAKAKTNVRRMEQQIDQIKATESVQKAQVAISSRHMGANSKVKTALSSLDRVKAKQAQRSAELEAAAELAEAESGGDLDADLRAAGIVPGGSTSGKDKLAALLAKKS